VSQRYTRISGSPQSLAVAHLGDVVRCEQALGCAAIAGAGLRDLDPHLAAQGAHRLGEGEVLHLHQERDGVAALLAAEAVEAAAIRADVEGRGLFVVEGTEAFVVGTRLLQRDEASDQADDVDAIADLLDGLFGDPAQPILPLSIASSASSS
jgi:hypothetical protein